MHIALVCLAAVSLLASLTNMPSASEPRPAGPAIASAVVALASLAVLFLAIQVIP